ncbi:MAG: DUF531 family protein [Candidatus Thermoplasmatota archaeon]|jgi:hypothetical protein
MTLGLYNCYDPKQWHDIMRITLARAAPVAMAFDCDLATIGFPFEQARARGAKRNDLALDSPAAIATFVTESSSIGDGGDLLIRLVEEKRFTVLPFPGPTGFPAKLGRLVATTPTPEAAKAVTPLQVAEDLAAGQSQLLLFGLGPRGLPAQVLHDARHHLELTGKGISMETSTALGALPALVSAHLHHVRKATA